MLDFALNNYNWLPSWTFAFNLKFKCYQNGISYNSAISDDPALHFVLDLKENICVCLPKDQRQNISHGRTSMSHVPKRGIIYKCDLR